MAANLLKSPILAGRSAVFVSQITPQSCHLDESNIGLESVINGHPAPINRISREQTLSMFQ